MKPPPPPENDKVSEVPPGRRDLPEQMKDESATGLPVLRTWPAVYVFVLAVFVLWVALLAAFTRIFA